MNPHYRRWLRAGKVIALGFVVLVVFAFLFVQGQQLLLRWRAERLLKDIRAIQMGKSTVADAQRLMYKWGASGERQGDCARDWCEFHVWMGDVSHALHRFPVLDGGNWESQLRWPRWMNRPFHCAGGRFVDVEAGFEVRNGIIWTKSFAVLITPLPEKYDSSGGLIAVTDTSLIGRSRSRSQCFHRGYGPGRAYFSVTSPEVCLVVGDVWTVAQFTPFADENTVRQLLDFNLDCLTRFKECRSAKELMPSAANLFENSGRRVSSSGQSEENFPLWILARDSGYAAIGEAMPEPIAVSPNHQRKFGWFRIVKQVKGDHLISDAGPYMVNTVGSDEICSVSIDENTPLKGGTKMLMFFDEPLNHDPARMAEFAPCVAVPITDQNWADAQRGIARDTVLRDSAVY